MRLTGELDCANVDLLAAVLDNQLARGYRSVRLDVSELTFVDTAGLHAVLEAHNRFLAARGRLALTGVGAPVARLLTLIQLDEVLLVGTPTSGQPMPRYLRCVPTRGER